MLKTIKAQLIEKTVIDLIYQSSFNTPPGYNDVLNSLRTSETSKLAITALDVISENAHIAQTDHLPLCQDCGVAIFFIEIGKDISLKGSLERAVNNGVQKAYSRYNLRKSIVKDPLQRDNTGTNTPAVIHTDIVDGDSLKITAYLKGGGSENMSSLKMFRPTDTVESILEYIVQSVIDAGPNPCPPLFIGVGIGGTADTALLNAKKAVLRGIGVRNPNPYYRDLEIRLEDMINNSNLGPLGFGGQSTTGGVYIMEAPTHIATLPLGLNLNCHSLRYRTKIL